MTESDSSRHIEIKDGDQTVAAAEVTTAQGAEGTARTSLHAASGHVSPGRRAELVDAVLDLPEVQASTRLEATVPLGDGESLERLREQTRGHGHPPRRVHGAGRRGPAARRPAQSAQPPGPAPPGSAQPPGLRRVPRARRQASRDGPVTRAGASRAGGRERGRLAQRRVGEFGHPLGELGLSPEAQVRGCGRGGGHDVPDVAETVLAGDHRLRARPRRPRPAPPPSRPPYAARRSRRCSSAAPRRRPPRDACPRRRPPRDLCRRPPG